MKFCVYGAGAIGGYIGLKLFEAGYDVTLVDKGKHLHALKSNGLTLHSDGRASSIAIPCTDDPTTLGPQDYVFVAVKTYSIPGILDQLQSLLHESTAVVNVNNGIPWWYFHGIQSSGGKTSLDSVDPGGKQWSGIGPSRSIGCVAYPACQVVAPGVIKHISGNRFALGEPSGEKTDRLEQLCQAMRAGGLKTAVKSRIRDEVWIKLWGNLAFNPISVLTGATLQKICLHKGTRALAKDMMLEARVVAESLGVRFSIDEEKRIEGAGAVGEHKTSMLQDYEAGRQLETDALVTSVQELGELVGEPTPNIDRVLALLNLKVSSESAATNGE